MTVPNTNNLQLDFGAVLMRAQRLGADCAPLTGANDRMITAGIVSLTGTPVLKEGQEFQWEVGSGDQIAEVKRADKIRRYDITGSIATVDREFQGLLFGGELIVADTGHPFAGNTIGWASPGLDSPENHGVYLEVFSQLAYEGAGDCAGAALGLPYSGHILPRLKLVPGEVTFQNEVRNVSFTGQAFVNPTANLDPFGDYPGVGTVPNGSAYIEVDYEALPAGAAPGTQSAA